MAHNSNQSLISGHPPLLVFTLCLTAFGLTMVILAYVIGEQDVPNPDVLMDWNKVFDRISHFKMCPVVNESKASNGELFSKGIAKQYNGDKFNSSQHLVDESKSMSAVLSDVVNSASKDKFDSLNLAEVSVKVQFKLHGKPQVNSFFQANGKIKGSLLGFTGKYASFIFNVSLSFLSSHNNSCSEENCNSLWEVCLTMSVPSDLLPETKFPERCDMKAFTSIDIPSVYFVDVKNSFGGDTSACLILNYASNSKLVEMLSLHDRSIVNLHLMHTSYFMFVMVMTLICYSLIKGRYRHPKNSYSMEKVPLDA